MYLIMYKVEFCGIFHIEIMDTWQEIKELKSINL